MSRRSVLVTLLGSAFRSQRDRALIAWHGWRGKRARAANARHVDRLRELYARADRELEVLKRLERGRA